MTGDSVSHGCDLWADLVHLEGAETLAAYAEGFYAGTPAVTRNAFGNGAAHYLGTRPDVVFMARLLRGVCEEAGLEPPLKAPPGVEVVRRSNGSGSFLFVLNHGAETAAVRLDRPGRELLRGEEAEGLLSIEPSGVAVVEERE